MPDIAFDLFREALLTAAKVAAPLLVAGVLVGVFTAILQAATQVQESSLSFVPKIVVLGLLLSLMGPGLLNQLATFGKASISRLADVGRRPGP